MARKGGVFIHFASRSKPFPEHVFPLPNAKMTNIFTEITHEMSETLVPSKESLIIDTLEPINGLKLGKIDRQGHVEPQSKRQTVLPPWRLAEKWYSFIMTSLRVTSLPDCLACLGGWLLWYLRSWVSPNYRPSLNICMFLFLTNIPAKACKLKG